MNVKRKYKAILAEILLQSNITVADHDQINSKTFQSALRFSPVIFDKI